MSNKICLALVLAALTHFASTARAQLSASLDVRVTQDNGIFTYDYTLTNSVLSAPLNAFLLTVARGTDAVEGDTVVGPEGWVGTYNPFLDPSTGQLARDFQVAYVAGQGFDCSDESRDVPAGGTASFSLTSTYGPGEQGFFLAKLVNDPVFGACAGIEGDPLEAIVLAPTVPPEMPTVDCDFDGDGDCDLTDIDTLGAAIAGGLNQAAFDLTGDSLVNIDDLDAFLADSRVQRLNGDANLDGDVGFPDFLVLSDNFGKTDIPWSGGNFVPSESVDFADFLVVADNFGQAAQPAAVPEPTAAPLWIAIATVLCFHRRGRGVLLG